MADDVFEVVLPTSDELLMVDEWWDCTELVTFEELEEVPELLTLCDTPFGVPAAPTSIAGSQALKPSASIAAKHFMFIV
jgi:hypothetical protein